MKNEHIVSEVRSDQMEGCSGYRLADRAKKRTGVSLKTTGFTSPGP